MSLPTPSMPNSTSPLNQNPQQTDEIVPGSKIPTTTSLLFGFLVSFLGLFIVFVAWGLASRYMMQRRQERFAHEAELMEGGANGCREPSLWNVWAMPGSEKWEEMMPLSVELRGTSSSSPTPDRHGSFTSAEQLLHMYRGLGRFSFASRSYRAPPREPVPISSQGSRTLKAEGSLELQIAVLVAMPSPASPTRDRAWAMNGKRASIEGQEHRLGMGEMSDIAVGVTTIPWDKERMDFG